MKFECPHCRKELEADQELARQEVECPACGHHFTTPTLGPVDPPPSVPVPSRAAREPDVSTGRGGGFGKFTLVVAILLLAALAYACYQSPQMPQDVWQHLVDTVTKQPTPPPELTPVLSRPSVPVPVAVTPPKVAPPVTNVVVVPAPPPAPDPLSWIAERAKKSTVQVTLLVDTPFPIIYEGKVAGSGNVPAQSIVNLVAVDLNTHDVTVAYPAYGNSTVTVPIASTDLLASATKTMAQAEATEAPKLTPSAVTPQSPTASSSEPAVEPVGSISSDANKPFIHPGLLHTDADFDRMKEKVNAHAEPWEDGWERLTANRHASLDWKPRPVETIYRGANHVHAQNYALLFKDIAAAYACALRWRISGDPAYADKAVEILNAWSGKLHAVDGSPDRCLAAGIYGYEFANAAEIMRTYPGWKPEDFKQCQSMMLQVFYTMNHDFLVRHNGAKIDHYWCNWDASNMDSMIAIGVLCDRRDIYHEAIDYFKHGEGNGSIEKAVVALHPGNLGQWQESGRDQGHNMLGIGLLGAFCEMAWNQGDDMYGYDDNRFLAGAEYVARYNLGEDVPYTTYQNSDVTQDIISEKGRGNIRPIWEMIYNHYVNRRGLSAPYSKAFAEKVRPEGGGGDYGPNSGGFDQLGYGTLTFTRMGRDPAATSSVRSSHAGSNSSAAGGTASGLAPTL